jgi:FkbH-like protein
MEDLASLFAAQDPAFHDRLREETAEVEQFSKLLALINHRKRAGKKGFTRRGNTSIRLAIAGGASLRPLADLVVHFVEVLAETRVELWVGEFDNYHSEILDPSSELYTFQPELVFVLPSERRCRYEGNPLDSLVEQIEAVNRAGQEILDLARQVHDRSGATVVLTNFRLPVGFDPGPMRGTNLQSDYAFRRAVNSYLGLQAPPFVSVCDVEFLSYRLGGLKSHDPRTWFESKQPYSTDLLVSVAKEVSQIVRGLRQPTKKVVVLDLDNTLWGGVVGDDGVDGIEIGTTSPRGEAFRDFQLFLKSLKDRGILLAVASKNDHEKAIEPFVSHPEMVLRLEDIVSFKANWEPKSENIREMATELSLGLDSFVFVDDNPAEIEIVRQFVPAVTGICVGDDPSKFRALLEDSRLFETRRVSEEDTARSALYQIEAQRQALKSQTTDMNSYLESLEMVADVRPFTSVDAPRISQLINKSNQFNLTTRRRTEAEVLALIDNPNYGQFTIRLTDKFGAHGLIAVVIGAVENGVFRIDTWLMSCRVLKRQVEDVTLSQIVGLARALGCHRVIGEYIPSAKNQMVADLYARLGFAEIEPVEDGRRAYELNIDAFGPNETKIDIRSFLNAVEA